MTREEEIVNRSIAYRQKTPSEYDDGRYDLSDLELAFEEGAKWADKTMIEKACKWLKNNADGYMVIDEGGDGSMHFLLINDFRKAMKGDKE